MPADPLVKRSATWMAQAVRDGDVSAAELLDARADRIEARNPAVNAIVLLVAHRPLGVRAALDHARGLELAQPRVSTSRGAPSVRDLVETAAPTRRRSPRACERRLTATIPRMAMTCPACGGELVELDRSGVRVDACRNCRGVWLDRGELDKIIEHERRAVAAVDHDEDDFVREMTGRGKPDRRYGLDPHTADRIYTDYRSHRKHKKRKSFLDELFD